MKVLVVTSPFGGREIGERITDEDEIDETLDGEHAHHVVAADHEITLAGDVTEEKDTQEA